MDRSDAPGLASVATSPEVHFAPMISDRELLERIRSRDAEALAELYDRHAPRLHALALRMTCDGPAAVAVLEETFRRIWDDKPDPQSDCTASLARITREAARKQEARRADAASGNPTRSTPRELVESAYYERRSVGELARSSGLAEPEVRRMLREGMDELRRQFSPTEKQ